MDTKDTLAKLLDVESKSSDMLKSAEKEANSIIAKAREEAAARSREALKEANQKQNEKLNRDKLSIDAEISAKINAYDKYLKSTKLDTDSFNALCSEYCRK